ncbi:DUF6691 family protein [Mesorhizobium sp.]|uniref:DUF6691 family protein n=1 Tax=Mesorhizobium sp. TaxID=1871066 RepID=UPI00341FE191
MPGSWSVQQCLASAGVGGFCPGPALTSHGLGPPGTLVFVTAMLIHMGMPRIAADPAPGNPANILVGK